MSQLLDAIAGRGRVRITSLAVVTLGLGLLALAAPVSRAEFPAARVGSLLTLAAGLELLHAMRLSNAAARRRATIGGAISLAIAIFLINAPFVAAQALRMAVAVWFAVDAVRYAIGIVRGTDRTERTLAALAALGNTALALLLLFTRGSAGAWVVAVAGAARILGIAWNIATAPVYTTADAEDTVVRELGLSGEPAAVALAAEVEAAERGRAPADRGWTIAFILTLFAIHMGRMRTDLTLLGLLSPGIAVLGDMALAVLIALLVINPLYLSWRRPTRWIERRVWQRYVRQVETAGSGWTIRVADAWLRWRMRYAIRMRASRYSLPAALNRALQTGLPVAAIVTAIAPVWGMNWYFDTENWAAGVWNAWAESRTDTWREAMVRAVLAGEGGRAAPLPFAVEPEGVAGRDFSFVVIGDPGEGDASQHVLRDQLLDGRRGRGRPVRRRVVGRRVPVGIDERLRGEVLAAVQGRSPGLCTRFPATTIGTTRSKPSRPHSFSRRRRARASGRGWTRISASPARPTRGSSISSTRRDACARPTRSRPDSSARRFSRSRPIGSRSSRSTPGSCSRSIRRRPMARGGAPSDRPAS